LKAFWDQVIEQGQFFEKVAKIHENIPHLDDSSVGIGLRIVNTLISHRNYRYLRASTRNE
jgi:hypothetical protein